MSRPPKSQPGELTLFAPGYRLQLLACGSRCQLSITSPVPAATSVHWPRSAGILHQPANRRRPTDSLLPEISTEPDRWRCEVEVLWVPRDDRGLPAGSVQSLDRLALVGRLAAGPVIQGALWLPSRLSQAMAFQCHYRPGSWQAAIDGV